MKINWDHLKEYVERYPKSMQTQLDFWLKKKSGAVTINFKVGGVRNHTVHETREEDKGRKGRD